MDSTTTEADLKLRVLGSISDISRETWDALTDPNDPFIEHAFLKLLEDSGAVSEKTGWKPEHLTVWQNETLVAAMPLYSKMHSYGEFIFDWAFANASHQLGVRYYPKLLSMIPFTPTTGRRLLLAKDRNKNQVLKPIAEYIETKLAEGLASSAHLLFFDDEEVDLFTKDNWMRRLSYQFHWQNQDYQSFEEYIGTFRASTRKQTRRERKRATTDVEVRVLEGAELGEEDWDALYRFYRNTCALHGSPQYLPKEFFDLAAERGGRCVVAALAYKQNQPIAGTLNFEKGEHLYGRYWGADGDFDCLHFELCYYQLIERAIHKKRKRFEAGAQGIHKLKRGLLPTPIHSAHKIANPVLQRAVQEFLPREAESLREEMAALAEHSPFKQS